ncbi:hypothetical protein SEA_TANIS_14 [Gordonia phage Tanis]|uniref:Uncharacterized protein n=1 Tax=Gordonia phage Tanis TaxID=2652415 RepID=A0A5P8D9D0_9CAUD|nr:hypothetical protein HWC73_gp14 [Gordonia phage Tanis]QFP95588.1 hypothetical protein SEA_TANIS_14 [Gordonia phage Tanis]QKY78686.1 hypothetical protein SEA_GILL_14 [Gordonia phage Gill]
MSEMTVDDFLEHHGVKGMKWGRRKSPEIRAARKEARSEVRQEFKENRTNALKKTGKDGEKTYHKGKVAVVALADMNTYGALSAARISKSAGASNGQAAAVAILTGLPGAVAYKEIRVRKEANRRVGG